MAEEKVVIESVSEFSDMWRHSFAGIVSFLIAKGLFLAPIQNLKSISQTGLKTNRDNSIMRSTGREIFFNFARFGIRIGVNHVLKKFFDLSGWFLSVPSIMCASLITFGTRTSRHRNFFTGVYHNRDMNNALVYSSMLAYDVGSELMAETLSDRYSDKITDKYLPGLEATTSRRLCESFFLGLSMMILNPLEVLMKRNMLCLKTPSNYLDYFKGSLYSFIEAFSLVSVKYQIYRMISGI
jgi:hypothetical protein